MILGAAGTALTPEEKDFYSSERPWAFILFARNIEEPRQIEDLCAEMRDCVGNPQALVFIDQEGGRVQRIRPPIASNYPDGATIGSIYRKDRDAGLRAAWSMSRLHAFDLLKLGITADCLPVLDIPIEGSSNVIGNRAYGADPSMVAQIGRAAAEGLMSGGVLPVMKHIPGHGRATTDSHLELPVVDAPLEDLRRSDFLPFKAMNDCPMAMTAHIVYRTIDAENPATTSAKLISEIIRDEIGFEGLLMSDDVSMKALSGDFATRTDAIFAAGCDVVLHCNGVMEEMRAVASATPALDGVAAKRAERAINSRTAQDETKEAAIRSEFEAMVASAA